MKTASELAGSQTLRSRLVFAALYAAFMVFMPWEAIQGYPLHDRTIYAEIVAGYAERGSLDTGNLTIIQALRDPLWTAILKSIAVSGVDPISAFLAITAVCSFVFLLSVSRHLHPLLTFILLTNPLMVDLLVSQLRSALAVTIIYCGSMFLPRFVPLAVASATSALVHVAVMPVGLAMFWHALLTRMASARWAAWIQLSLGILAAIFLAFGVSYILELLGDWRAEAYTYGSSQVPLESPRYIAFWGLLLGALMAFRPRDKQLSMEYSTSILVLALVVTATMLRFGIYRYVPLAFPLILVAMAQMNGWHRKVTIASFAAYSVLLWYYWIFVAETGRSA